MIDAEERYNRTAQTCSLHALEDLKEKPDLEEDRKELIKTYKHRLVGRGGRAYYDYLRTQPQNGVCPLCGHRLVSTLDHYLPKTTFPLLAVTPINLVPACKDCNHAKKDTTPTQSEDHTLHPYYDDISKDQWLFAQVIENSPAAIEFFVKPPMRWDSVLKARVRRHFEIFDLAELYGPQAASAMASHRGFLTGLFRNDGAVGVQQYLEDMAKSCAANAVNGWQTAMYQALAASVWYTSGGLIID